MANAVNGGARTFTATIVAVSPAQRLEETLHALRTLHARASVQPIVVTLGDNTQPPVREKDGATIIDGLTPRYLNNVVAARRLSSLPAVAWWRGGDRGVLDGLAALVDRLVMDSDEPVKDWRAAATLVELTAFGDLRWTRLTRWRNLMAQFFDVPEVRASAAAFSRLEIHAADAHAANLFAGWLVSRLPRGRAIEVKIAEKMGRHPISTIALASPTHRLELRLTPNETCVATSIEGGSQPAATRTVSLGDQTLAALLEEELRIRARDVGFEQALRVATGGT